MYEPKYMPELMHKPLALTDIKFGITHSKKYIKRDDPESDPLHIHSYLEIFFNLSSDVSFFVNNNLYPIPPLGAIFSMPNDIHVCIFEKASVHEHICLWIEADFESSIFNFLRKNSSCPLLTFEEESASILRQSLLALEALCKSNGDELEKTSSLLTILTILNKGNAKRTDEAKLPETLQKIIYDIDRNFADIHSINDILNSYFISSATLTRWFRKYVSASPREYLESKKLSCAAKLLTSGANVTTACFRSGFADCSHFISLFKRKFGKTPLQYKKDL